MHTSRSCSKPSMIFQNRSRRKKSQSRLLQKLNQKKSVHRVGRATGAGSELFLFLHVSSVLILGVRTIELLLVVNVAAGKLLMFLTFIFIIFRRSRDRDSPRRRHSPDRRKRRRSRSRSPRSRRR